MVGARLVAVLALGVHVHKGGHIRKVALVDVAQELNGARSAAEANDQPARQRELGARRGPRGRRRRQRRRHMIGDEADGARLAVHLPRTRIAAIR